MILRITVDDNDYTSYIENFLDAYNCDIWSIVMSILEVYINNTDTYRSTYRELDNFLASLRYKEKYSKKEKSTLINYIKRALVRYLKDDRKKLSYICDNIKITFVNSVKSKWENGEVVYFFTSYHKYITM